MFYHGTHCECNTCNNKWTCRMKIYQTIKNICGYCDTFNSIVEVDGKYERISFKGCKNKSWFIDKLGRLPRHHRSCKVKCYTKKE